MIPKVLVDGLNEQINAELFSAYLYMSMSSYASNAGYKGAAQWFAAQTKEELVHAQKIYDYVSAQGEHVRMAAIDAPQVDFDSLEHLFEETLKHEQKVTGLINDLADLAIEQKSHATSIFLQWFITEQVEEEETAREILDNLRLAGSSGPGVFMIDKELAARVFTPPAA